MSVTQSCRLLLNKISKIPFGNFLRARLYLDQTREVCGCPRNHHKKHHQTDLS